MNTDFIINEEWVAIRDFPHISSTSIPNCTTTTKKHFEIHWDDEKRLIEIFYIECDDAKNKWEHNISYSIDAFVANHIQLKTLLPDLDLDLPSMPSEPKGNVFIIYLFTYFSLDFSLLFIFVYDILAFCNVVVMVVLTASLLCVIKK